ncbi:MAG: outer membrane protein assembly factor BamA [Lysobacterales bacterium]|nr:outer membrane protein assembly factor BamA [Xanthomonadales bacterium]MCP5475849.1 outer membrane protein assembly factor BamA [Rhodanobacteraceae bacterium]
MKKLVASILLALSGGAALAADDFVISDIRIDGLERISAGTVFTYLPVQKGDRLDRSRASDALRSLYKTGFFKDVRLDRQGDILVVTVSERPAISKITLVGNKDIKTEELTKGLDNIGLAEGETYNELNIERVTQELTRQYNNRGKYNVRITPSVKSLDRNRVDVTITIAEGKAAKIRHLNIVGNTTFTDEEIRKEFELDTTNWLSWYRRDDQYSREKLSGDLEKLRAFYLDRGYVDFDVESTQVSVSPDRRNVYITANVNEGEVYTVGEVRLTGKFVVDEATLNRLVVFKTGETFSRKKLEQTSEYIEKLLGNFGYAFAKVSPVPDVDREKRIVGITMLVDPGKRVYVRRINFEGNAKTLDEVLRREMRQFEGGWYNQAAIDRSKVRLERLGFFKKVEVETPKVAGSDDQVDVVVKVEEQQTGNFQFGVGYSELQGAILSVALSFDNFLGTGNRVGFAVSNNRVYKRFDASYYNPYYTDEGVSRGFNVSYRELDSAQANLASYTSNVAQVGMNYGLPLSEYDRINFRLALDQTQIDIYPGLTPAEYIPFVYDNRTFNSWRLETSWFRDSRNRFFSPTAGALTKLTAELVLPPSELRYYKISAQYQKYFPLTQNFTLMLNGEVGYGDTYSGSKTNPVPDENGDPLGGRLGFPFWENFYSGGVRSVRGFRDNTLGPRLLSGSQLLPVGGALSVIGNVEFLFPTPFAKGADTIRLGLFFDVGNVYKDFNDFDAGELRYSTGLTMQWRAPVGPIVINLAYPLNDKPGDDVERIQFSFGNQF